MTAHRKWPLVRFGKFLRLNRRPYLLGSAEDADLVGMRWYGLGPFHREHKAATQIRKKTHFVIRENDVIFNKLFAWKGSFGVVPSELDGMFVSDKFPTYSLDAGIVDRDYLRWYFRYPPLWDQAREMSTGSAALSKLTLNPPRFMDLMIPVPSIEEQRRIVCHIEDMAAKIAAARELQSQTDDERRALRGAFLRVVSSQHVQLGTLGRIMVSKPRNGWSAKCDNASDGIPVLTLSAITGYFFNETAFKRTSMSTDKDAHYWLRSGDLLITRSNTPLLVGHAAIYEGQPSPCIYPDLMMRIDINETLTDRRFVWLWLQTPLVREYIERNAKGTSPTMKKISQPVVMGIPFPANISVAEQRLVLSEMDALQAKMDEVRTLQKGAIIELDAVLPSVLDQVFTGAL